MPDVILETGTGQDYEDEAEAYGVIPLNAADAHAIRHKIAEVIGTLTWSIGNSGNVKHRWEADPSVRHDGETVSGVVVDSLGGVGATIRTNDIILQDLHFTVTVGLVGYWVDAGHASADRLWVRRCTSSNPLGAVGHNIGFYMHLATDQAMWFCTAGGFGGTQTMILGIGCSGYFSASTAGLLKTPTHLCNLSTATAGRLHGMISLTADGPSTVEYTGSKSGTMSHNLGEGEVAPGTDPIDLTDDLGLTFPDVFKGTDGTNWGIKDSFIALPGVAYGGIDVTGFDGYEALDVYGKVIDPDNLVIGPKQLALPTGGVLAVARQRNSFRLRGR